MKRMNGNGWIKIWINGKLRINLDKNAWDGTPNESDASGWTTGYGLPNSFQTGSYFNDGPPRDQLEWIDDIVISGSYIGPIGGSEGPDTVTGLKIVK